MLKMGAVGEFLGLDSRSVAFCQSYFNYPVDEVLWDDRAGTLIQPRYLPSANRRMTEPRESRMALTHDKELTRAAAS